MILDRKSLRRENGEFRNSTLYAERNTCPNFLDKGQAVLESDRVPSSTQPNLFEELTIPEMAAVSHLDFMLTSPRAHLHASGMAITEVNLSGRASGGQEWGAGEAYLANMRWCGLTSGKRENAQGESHPQLHVVLTPDRLRTWDALWWLPTDLQIVKIID